MIPPLFFLVREPELSPAEVLLPSPDDFPDPVLFVPVDLAFPLDCLAPPDAVRLPAAPLLVAVEVFEPPDFEAVTERTVEVFDPAFLLVPADVDAPVLLVPELFEVELLFEPPVFAVADLFPPWLDLEDDLVAEADRDPVPFEADDPDFAFVELFAAAICGPSKYVEFEHDLSRRSLDLKYKFSYRQTSVFCLTPIKRPSNYGFFEIACEMAKCKSKLIAVGGGERM